MLALGEELQRRNHSVVITVNENLVEWARGSTVQIVSLPHDSEAKLKSLEGRKMLARGATLRFTLAATKVKPGSNRTMLHAQLYACHGADLILSTALTTYRAMSLAEHLQCPHAAIATAPLIETAEFPMLLTPTRSLGSSVLHRSSYKLYRSIWWRASRAPINKMRRVLGLPTLIGRPKSERVPSAGIYSAALSPRPYDWDVRHQITGCIVPTRELRRRLNEDVSPPGLERWLAAGEATGPLRDRVRCPSDRGLGVEVALQTSAACETREKGRSVCLNVPGAGAIAGLRCSR